MTVEQWQTLSFIAFILAGVFLTAAVILFFVFRIPRIAGYLTGRTAKKAIAQIAANNGKMEEDAGEIQERYSMNFRQSESGHSAGVTERLDLTETVLLRPEAEETTLLSSGEPPARSEDRMPQTEFQLIRNIIFVHSKEVI